MARPITLNIDGRLVHVTPADAHMLLRTPEDIAHRLKDIRQVTKWINNKRLPDGALMYILSRGDTDAGRRHIMADHIVYEETENPEYRTRIFPPHPSNGTYAIQYRRFDHLTGKYVFEVLDFTRSYTSHKESWARFRDHLSTRYEDIGPPIIDPGVFSTTIVDEIPLGGAENTDPVIIRSRRDTYKPHRTKRNRLRVQDLDAFGRDT